MNTKEGAEKILRHIESVYIPQHRYALVDARAFKHLDLRYYDKVQRYLESQGFHLICDKEDLTISEAPGECFTGCSYGSWPPRMGKYPRQSITQKLKCGGCAYCFLFWGSA